MRKLHQSSGGTSVHTHFGNLQGQRLFAVSLYPERTVRIQGREIPPEVVMAYMRQHADLLRDARIFLGTWYNAEEDITYLDISVACLHSIEALQRGQQYNQIAIYDLEREAEVDIGGTGDEPSEIPPETERLPPLHRSRKG